MIMPPPEHNAKLIEEDKQILAALSQVPAPCDGSAWEVDYDMFSHYDYTKKEKMQARLNDGWVEMGMTSWPEAVGFHVWWKRQNAPLHLQGGAAAEPCNGESGCSQEA